LGTEGSNPSVSALDIRPHRHPGLSYGATVELSKLIDECYRERSYAWNTARALVQRWLEKQCSEVLKDGDGMRLKVEPGRVKEQGRALWKLSKKLDEDPTRGLATWQDVERALGDVVGLKVLCKSTRDQRLFAEHLQTVSGVDGIDIVEGIRDYVANPKPSGYRAVHVQLEVSVAGERGGPVPVELQIKTRVQDAWGELTHEDLYKPGGGAKPSAFQQSVAKKIADLLAVVDGFADDLAEEVSSAIDAAPDAPSSADLRPVTISRTGPKYALAEDANGRRGLIQARAGSQRSAWPDQGGRLPQAR
jgi:putative GTP pyrophosphokinase